VKLDNLVHIAHNVEIGDNTAMAAQCGIAGSTKIGKNCILAGQVGIVGHISIADRTIFGAQSGCSRTVKNEGEMLMGYPVRPLMKYKRITAIEHKLPEIYEEFNALKKEVEELKKKLNQ
jgi:UDP-3-O-[3-hydroxymyristoyl] glucosamine N-acyltransferase